MTEKRKKTSNVPNLRFPGFMGDWEERKLGEEIKESGYGPRFSGEDYNIDGNVKTIRGTDIALNGEILYDQVPLAFLNNDFIKNHILEDGDLVMITTADCGLTGVFRKQEIHYIPSAYAVKLRMKKSANPEYFKYLLQTTIAYNQVNKFIRKATIGNLPGSDILKFKFKIPSLPEQDKIASLLSLIDNRIQTQIKIIEELIVLKSTVSKQIFSQELRFKDDKDCDFPEWENKKLNDICFLIMGQSPSSTTYNTNGIGAPLIQGNADISNRITTPRNWTTEITKECNIGDIILTVRAPVGAVARSLHNACIGRGVCAIKGNSKSSIEFIYQFLLYYEDKWNKLEQGSTFTAVSGSEIQKVKIKLPCLKEQTLIAAFLSSIDSKINLEKQLLQKLEEQKKYLLQNLFV